MELIAQQGDMFTTTYRNYPVVIMVLGVTAGRQRVLRECIVGEAVWSSWESERANLRNF